MKAFESHNATARAYLQELRAAFTGRSSRIRDEIVRNVADELQGLDEASTRERIEALGNPGLIAAEATTDASDLSAPAPSRTYSIVTSIVLIAGWYLVPVIGWVAGLIMIGVGDRWSGKVRRKGIIASVGVIALSVITLVVFRGSDLWPAGLIFFLVGPFIGNIFVADFLRRR